MKREFDRKIWKSGNSYVVTIPSETIERYGLLDKFVTVSISDEVFSEKQAKKTKKEGKNQHIK